MEMLEKYVDLLDDTELKLQLAKEFRLTKLAADVSIVSCFNNTTQYCVLRF